MERLAQFSDCRSYRYALWRTWEPHKPFALFVGLNPSVADEVQDDPTITRCIGFAKSWGYGGLCMANLFAYVSTDPGAMLRAPDPVGPENDAWLVKLAKGAGVAVAAWGNKGMHLGRSKAVRQMLPNLNCLALNKGGEPRHPLYLKADLTPVPL